MAKITGQIFVFLTIFAIATGAMAKQELYKIEVIAFKYNNNANNYSQQASTNPQGNSINLSSVDSENLANTYQLLPKTELDLMAHERALKRKKNYQVLLHVAWLQDFSRKNRANSVHLYGGNLFDASGDDIANSSSIYAMDKHEINTSLQWQLDGKVRVKRNKFFDFDTNLLLLQPNFAGQANTTDPLLKYQLKQTQRMRSNVLHYFDHPQFGLIAKITPFEVEQFAEPG